MNICIFGADGRTGVEVVNYTKSKGHDVTAFVYGDNSNKFFPENIKILKGDILNYEDVRSAVSGSDAVISVVGHIKNSDPRMQTKGIINIINAMNNSNIRRLISLTGTGVRIDDDKPSIMDIFLNFIVKLVDLERIKDGIEHAKEIEKSGLDWTILRVLKLSNSQKEGKYNLTEHGPAELTSPRKKVAKIMVDLVDSGDFINKMPVSSKN